ncbi:tripartite tricarboxylate transporter substrate-binding protein [Salisediminibacterium beveridgei]|uniref:Tricarboxylate transport protein TctC n=1 Tax=Salisediminibacterium beveridgei TaxID=632773 RepID=A0A1D7QS53_9BACI|nr:tripartite tricarboxylate transporter substrate-binding protein [Salisediminibacterium beveridgei]AOM81844.1 Tricarboxylate transport protein TctC [Salisediminibacterium beveridgei]
MKKRGIVLMSSVLLALTACGNNMNEDMNEAAGDNNANNQNDMNNDNNANDEVAETDWEPDSLDVLIPLSPGGGVERRSRVIATHFEDIHGIPLNLELMEGGGTVVGTNHYLQNMEPNAENIYINWEYAFTGGVFRDAPYGLDDFMTVSSYTDIHLGLVVNADSEWETFEEFVTYAEENPGGVSLGGTTGSTDQIVTQAFMDHFDLDINFVPYDGGGGVRTDVAGGHIDGMIGGTETAWSAFGTDEMRTLTLFTEDNDELRNLAPQEITFIEDEMAEHFPDMDVPDVFTGLTNYHFIAIHQEAYENHPERFEVLMDMFQEVLDSDQLREEARENYWISNPVLGQEAQDHWEWVHSVAEDNRNLFVED